MPENSIEPGSVSLRNLSISGVQAIFMADASRGHRMIGVAAMQHQTMSGLMSKGIAPDGMEIVPTTNPQPGGSRR